MDSTTRPATSARRLGQVIRAARKAQGLTLAQLGERTGYSAAQVSRYERGITPPGLATLRRLATALEISPHLLGLTAWPARRIAPSGAPGQHAGPGCSTVAREAGPEDGEQVRRRELLADLAAASASAAVGLRSRPGPSRQSWSGRSRCPPCREHPGRDVRPDPAARYHDPQRRAGWAGGGSRPLQGMPVPVHGRYTCPASISASTTSWFQPVTTKPPSRSSLSIYTLATRMLIKLDDQQLGWMAADRAKSFAASSTATHRPRR